MNDKTINILIVDDSEDYSTLMKFWLLARGHNVTSVLLGREALTILRKEAPDMIFLDINMPEMDGIETLGHIRKINKDIPVIMVTAGGSEEERRQAESLGVSGIFNKSDDFSEAAKLIQDALSRLNG